MSIGNISSIVISFILILAVSFSCNNNDTPGVTLIANAGPDQMVKPNQAVTLDGSASSGPSGFTYSWMYTGTIPEGDINFQNSTTANPTFTPPIAGLYTFSNTIFFEGQLSF